MKKQTKLLIGFGVLALVIAAMAILYWNLRPKGAEGSKTLQIQVVVSKEDTRSFTVHTDEEFLGPALLKEKLIDGEESQYGLFITTVDGVKADDSKHQWWCITKSGEELTTGADSTPIADGESYELTLSTY